MVFAIDKNILENLIFLCRVFFIYLCGSQQTNMEDTGGMFHSVPLDLECEIDDEDIIDKDLVLPS